MPNQTNPYRQTTNVNGGIELEDWEAHVVDLCTGEETDITAYFTVDSVFTDANGDAQFKWSITNIPNDFGYSLVYLKVSQLVGETFYSNPFQITANESDNVSRFDYRNDASDVMQSIGIKIWYWQNLKTQEINSYYETSTRNTVTALVKSQKYQRWITDWISVDLLIKISEIFEQKYVYLDLVRAYLFEAIEPPEHTAEENFAENILKIAFNSSDVYDPLYVPPAVDNFPSITLDSVVTNGVSAIYTFSYANFTPTYLVFEYSDDQVTWTSENKGVTTPQSVAFNGTGTWYFRISHPEAISNVIQLDLGDAVVAIDDSLSVQKGATIDISVLFNDTLVGDTVITAVSTPTNGTAIIIESGTKIQYTHNDSSTTFDSFTYTIDNGITSDTATVSLIVYGTTKIPKSFLTSLFGNNSRPQSCLLELNGTRYFTGNGTIPQLGDDIYTDASATTSFNGEDRWYPIGEGKTIKIATSGEVLDVALC